ncbi:U-Kazal-Dg21.2-like [Episyrphus balteatus]|uniref:U-Kazal-Dg21.2-like n=1 Tax=Episyrphus balteatus TaxID=286459 RepID=UPI00248626D8|nr:U-Kazal-Dg21.2-like [Episyrphus balteatus]
MKNSLFLISLILHLAVFGFCDSKPNEPKRCSIAYKCSSLAEPVWTTSDDVHCEVFRNNCYLLNDNCQRVNRDEPEAKKIEKERCQELCESAPPCSEVDTPVCGYYDEEKQTFASQCDMKKFVCKTGKTFDLFAEGECPKV